LRLTAFGLIDLHSPTRLSSIEETEEQAAVTKLNSISIAVLLVFIFRLLADRN